MVDPQKPCGKCGAVDRSKFGKCRPCRKKAMQAYRESAEGRAKIKAYDIKYRDSDKFRERKIAAKEKFTKRQFEFSLQTQQKVIEQCQPKST